MKKNKKFIVLLILIILVLSNINIYAQNNDSIKIYINNKQLITNESSVIINNDILVPFKDIFEMLNFQINWESSARQINAERITNEGRIYCNIQVDNNRMIIIIEDYLNNNSFVNDVTFEVPPQIINGIPLVPLKAISEALGNDIKWNISDKTILITTNNNLPTLIELKEKANATQSINIKNAFNPIKPITTTDVIVYSDSNKPIVGDIPGNILKNPNDSNNLGADKYTDAYMYGTIGVCTWYAKSRFYEVHGIRLHLYDLGKLQDNLVNATKYENLKVITDINDIQGNTIARFTPKDSTSVGHMVYVEYVERNLNGNPINIYITETNGTNTLNKGKFDPGYDGVVEKMTFDEFKNISPTLKLTGYIAARK